MDKILLSGIELYVHGGVSDAERNIGQRYRVHVELDVDLEAAGHSDSVRDTVYYGKVHDAVVNEARAQQFCLLESLAERIARRLLADFSVPQVTLEVQKLLPPIDGVVAYAAVRITRASGG